VIPAAAADFAVLSPDLSLEHLRQLLEQWGYLAVFLGMLAENAGVPLPGETITLLAGYAAGSGQLSLAGVIGAAVVGAVLGDNLGYLAGRLVGWDLIVRVGSFLRVPTERMEGLRLRFRNHADLSVLLGRFVAVLRVLAGPMAGSVRMPYPRFLVFNLIGAVLWASTMVSLAWLGGRWIPLERMVQGVLEFGLGAFVLVALIVLVPRLLSRWEGGWLERLPGRGPADPGDGAPPGSPS
jgi:membrane protein DedA with SNARE-associated domain